MRKEPKRIKLNETPTAKDVKKIPMPSLENQQYDISMNDDVYIRPDNDSIYKPIKNNENNSENNS